MAVEPSRLAAQRIAREDGVASEVAEETRAGRALDTLASESEELTENAPVEDIDADADAEGDTDAEADEEGDADADADDSEDDRQAQAEDTDDEGDAYEEMGTVKLGKRKRPIRSADEDAEADLPDEAPSDESENDSDDACSSESESENDWEGESDEEEDVTTEAADPNSCWFCKQTEENDPSEEYEEYLACAVCGDNAHRQCARDANALEPNEDANHWRCPTCVDHGLEEDKVGEGRRRSLNSSRMQKDLLPTSRGSSKPDSHSVFNTLILDDDPMDGSRSLRKRKGSVDTEDPLVPATRKRRRKSSATASADELASPGSVPSTIHVASHRNDPEEAAPESEVEGSEPVRSARLRRTRKVEKSFARVTKSNAFNLVMAFRLDAARLSRILSSKPKRKRIRDRSRKMQLPPPEPEVSHYPAIQTTNWPTALYSFHEKENDELKSKPYGGILSEAEADTSKTFPMALDRKRFEDARQKAEEDWKRKIQAANGMEPLRPSQKMSGPPSKIKCINFGGYEIDTWHAAPYPEEYSRNKVLYICEFCLKYMNSDYVAWRHKLKCPAKHPPGDEIYRDGPFSFFEVDGRKNPVYCQNLCLLAKLFLGSKTLYYDVEPFLFYIMAENDDFGCHFVGYFSKEKRPSSQNNVSCILVLPIHQRRGFGHLLIEFSYLLTREEKKTGSPEKPLSDMGLVSYRSYWRLILCYQLRKQRKPLSVTQLSERTGMTADDIVSALEGLRALVRDPVSRTYALRLDYNYLDEYVENYEKKGYVKLNPDALVWTPYVMGRGNLATYEQGPALQTVAPREGEGEQTPKAPEEGVQMANNTGPATDVDIEGSKLAPDPATRAGNAVEMDGIALRDEEGAGTTLATFTPQLSFSGPQTPGLVNGNTADSIQSTTPTSAIPPTRFEVFPPIPGAGSRRRAGRSLARSTSRRNGTPVRRTSDRLAAETPKGETDGIADSLASPARRTRSKLVDMVNGEADEGEGVEGSANVEADQSGPELEASDDHCEEQADQHTAPGELGPMTGQGESGDVSMEDA